MIEILIQLAYLFAAFLFITALRVLGRPDSARRGMQLAAFGMAVAVMATLFHSRIVSYEWIVVGATVGAIAGYPLGMWVPMTAMPQRIALSHAFGALAATLVGIGEYTNGFSSGTLVRPTVAALGLEVLFGGVTVTGSLIAFGKLQGILPGRPLIFRGQNAINLLLLAIGCCCLAWVIVYPTQVVVFGAMVAIAVLVGILFVLPIGGADMPVIVSLLNSYAGLAAVATGFAIDNNILIIVGALDGLSGFILAIAMSKAMNRSFANVLFGAFGSTDTDTTVATAAGGEMSATTVEDAALRLAYAKRVIMVPGYGLAVSQAQHQMRELGDLICWPRPGFPTTSSSTWTRSMNGLSKLMSPSSLARMT
jgi:NAD(P) transhydrogenase subunit beta